MIKPDIANKLYEYLSNQCDQAGCIAMEVDGYIDHVHILCRLSKNVTIPKLLEKIKGTSSKWIKTKFPELKDFYWQDGYGAFSVSANEVANVITYIQNQTIHHQSKSFQEEYLELLNMHKVIYDPKYLWD
jgi:REP element-mobilizing transposase RayT